MLNQSIAAADPVFHALADPTRRSIVERLSRGAASVSELAKPLTISLPAVLEISVCSRGAASSGTEKIGRVRTCHIEPAALGTAEQWIAARRADWEQRLDRLGDYLEHQAVQQERTK